MKKIFLVLLFSSVFGLIKAQTTLPTSWNFSSPGITTPPTGWTMGLGTNGNLTYAFGTGDALSARLDATNEFFMIQFSDKPGPMSYYLSPQNAGAAWGGQFDIQESSDGSAWLTMRSITSKATTSTNYTGGRYIDNPLSTTRYIRFYYTSKLPGGVSGVPGGNMGVDSVWIQSAPAAPVPSINVKKGANSLVSGSTVLSGNANSTVFTIENKGTLQSLSIDSVLFSGAASSDFSVSGLPISVGPGNSSSLNVSFITSIIGSRKASMAIYCNDSLKSPFILNLYGIGGNYATEPTAQPSNLNFTNVRSFGYEGRYSFVGSRPERFIVLRKLGSELTETPIDGITYQQGDYIGQAQVESISDSTDLLAPHFIHANSEYYYAIFSCNGFGGYENYLQSNPLKGKVSTLGRVMGNYYNGINPSSPGFISNLSAKINPHDTIYYSNNIPRFISPWLARDTSNGRKVVTCVYTGHQFVYTNPFQWANGTNGAVLTREHTWAQSWMPSNVGNPDWPNAIGTNKELPEYNDLFNLYPAHQANANAKRSNNPFDEVLTPTYTSPTGFGLLGKDSANRTAYEPKAEQKGDLARSLFYMAVCYNGVNGKSWVIPSNQNIALLKYWHQMDPPDNLEIAKNEFIFANQKNRNPFIDHPEWVERINFGNLSYIPFDTLSPKQPNINLISPISSDIWGKGKESKISWISKDIDTLQIYFSEDSLKTQIILATVAAASDSLKFIGGFVYNHPTGVIIIKDKFSEVADTSAYFTLTMVDGLSKTMKMESLNIYPNPAINEISLGGFEAAQNDKYIIYDFSGIKITEGDLLNTKEVDIKNLLNGYYVLQILTNSATFQKVFIKN